MPGSRVVMEAEVVLKGKDWRVVHVPPERRSRVKLSSLVELSLHESVTLLLVTSVAVSWDGEAGTWAKERVATPIWVDKSPRVVPRFTCTRKK